MAAKPPRNAKKTGVGLSPAEMIRQQQEAKNRALDAAKKEAQLLQQRVDVERKRTAPMASTVAQQPEMAPVSATEKLPRYKISTSSSWQEVIQRNLLNRTAATAPGVGISKSSSVSATSQLVDPDLTVLASQPVEGSAVSALRDDFQLQPAYSNPIVCILGHVDTGKTKILDNLRKTAVQSAEAGGITQQIGATYFPMSYLQTHCGLNSHFPGLLIIDTPGHESFNNLRTRGSNLCHVCVLVVDIFHGLEKQTIESLEMILRRNIPFVVALNKIDRLVGFVSHAGASPTGPQPSQSRKSNKAESSSTGKVKKTKKHVSFDLRKQKLVTQNHFRELLNGIKLSLSEKGLNSALFNENFDPLNVVSLVPTSAITGDGIPDLISEIDETAQRIKERLFNQNYCYFDFYSDDYVVEKDRKESVDALKLHQAPFVSSAIDLQEESVFVPKEDTGVVLGLERLSIENGKDGKQNVTVDEKDKVMSSDPSSAKQYVNQTEELLTKDEKSQIDKELKRDEEPKLDEESAIKNNFLLSHDDVLNSKDIQDFSSFPCKGDPSIFIDPIEPTNTFLDISSQTTRPSPAASLSPLNLLRILHIDFDAPSILLDAQLPLKMCYPMFECTILEVKQLEGHGMTVDCILARGVIKENDKILLNTYEDPVVTTVRSVLVNEPCKESRVKSNFKTIKIAHGCCGIKLAAQDLEKALPGTSILKIDPFFYRNQHKIFQIEKDTHSNIQLDCLKDNNPSIYSPPSTSQGIPHSYIDSRSIPEDQSCRLWNMLLPFTENQQISLEPTSSVFVNQQGISSNSENSEVPANISIPCSVISNSKIHELQFSCDFLKNPLNFLHALFSLGFNVRVHRNGEIFRIVPFSANTFHIYENVQRGLEELHKDKTEVLKLANLSEKGCHVQASTLGSLEALLSYLKIPIASIEIGPLTKRDIKLASSNTDKIILAFDLAIPKDILEFSKEAGVKIISANIIYHLLEEYNKHTEKELQKQRNLAEITFPSISSIVKNSIFTKRSPLVLGVEVRGILRTGTEIIAITDFKDRGIEKHTLGRIVSIENNGKQIDQATTGDKIAIKIETKEIPRVYKKHFSDNSLLVSNIRRHDIDQLKLLYKDDLKVEDWKVVIELKKHLHII